MNGSRKELEERLAAAERLLKAMEASLAQTKKLIDETRAILDEAKDETGKDNGAKDANKQ